MAKKPRRKEPVTPPQRNAAKEQDDLVKEFSALIEESLIVMMLQEQGFEEAQRQLAQIAQNVREEEASGFDPSGLPGAWPEPVRGNSETATSTTQDDAPPSSSAAKSSSGYGGSVSASRSTPTSDALDDWRPLAHELPSMSRGDGPMTPEDTLKEAFPALKALDIKSALKESGGDIDKASDILLNYIHLEESGERKKGIEGFFSPDERPNQLLKKIKKKHKKSTSNAPATLTSMDCNENSNSAKKGRTALAVEYKLSPLKLDEEEEGGGGSKASGVAVLPTGGASLAERNEIARQAREGTRAAFDSATAAWRRGRSDRHFRQVAAVYAERGHEHAAQARAAESAASDALVDTQSSGNHIDLHYVPVHDGVRNALERTQQWWAGLGENRIRKAREDPLRVVTGIGRNSERGYSRMYGEVGAALEREGWKVQPAQGHYLVTGKK